MSLRGPEMEGRAFAHKWPEKERRKAFPGEIENILRERIEEVAARNLPEPGDISSIPLCDFDGSPNFGITSPTKADVIIEDDRDEVWEKFLGIMKEYGFNPNNFSLEEVLKLKYEVGKNLEIRRYPTRYQHMAFESKTVVIEDLRLVEDVWWEVVDMRIPDPSSWEQDFLV